jgi:hypothetical protein
MTGPTAAVELQIQIEETFDHRSAFFRWLYGVMYETETPAGALARQILRADSFAYHILRNRSSASWVRQVQKRGWKVDPELLMGVWNEWRAVRP